MISQSYCHTSVTLDNMVTVMVTSYEVTEKDLEGFRRIEELTDYNLERSSKKGKIITTRVKSIEEKKVSIYFLTS